MTISTPNLISRRKLLMSLSVLAFASPAAADPVAEAFVTKVGSEAVKLASSGLGAQAMRKQFASLLTRNVNMRNIANFALGPYQKKLPAARKDEFYDLVTNYAAALFAWYAKDFTGSGVEVVTSAKQGAFTVIQTSIKGNSGIGQTSFKWYLQKAGSGYRVVDVSVKNVRLAVAMKQRFGDLLSKSKGNFDPLFAELKEANNWWS